MDNLNTVNVEMDLVSKAEEADHVIKWLGRVERFIMSSEFKPLPAKLQKTYGNLAARIRQTNECLAVIMSEIKVYNELNKA